MKDIVFLSHQAALHFGSSTIRAEQMASLVRPSLEQRGIRVRFTTDPQIRNALIILNKGFLLNAPLEDLASLKAQGNIIIADYIDAKPNLKQIEMVDGLMACSLAQESWFREHAPTTPVFHVTHNVDSSLPTWQPPNDHLRPGYFGALLNAAHREELAGIVDFFESSPSDRRWMTSMSAYNCHYAIRKQQSWDGFKPFMKGFIAARQQSPIIVAASDNEALAYLGDDYPYIVRGNAVENVKAVLDQAKADFGCPIWNNSLEAMARIRERSTDDFIANEFLSLASYYLAMGNPKELQTRKQPTSDHLQGASMSSYREAWEQPQEYASDKWDHYFDIYERHFRRYKEIKHLKLLEIGVQNGGSISTNRIYFGASAKIYGLDIDPKCKIIEKDGPADRIFIGSQSDKDFLEKVIEEIGGSFDVIIDDGSHQQEDMISTFQALFPHLRDGGTYIIEDTHTVYFPDHQNSLSGLNVYDYFKALTEKLTLDFINPEHRRNRFTLPIASRGSTYDTGNRMTKAISGIHFYNSMIVIEKDPHKEPLRRRRIAVGNGE